MNDIFSAIGILLVFATVALDIIAKDANIFIQSLRPDGDKEIIFELFKQKKRSILLKLGGITFFYITIIYLLIPDSVEIIKSSRLSIWKFDLLPSAYILTNICVLFFAAYSIILLIRTSKKQSKFNPD